MEEKVMDYVDVESNKGQTGMGDKALPHTTTTSDNDLNNPLACVLFCFVRV
jgi:hypothetical protein